MYNQNQQNTFKQGLDFRIADVSSEDPEYPASELLHATPQSKGWQTQRFAVFPQHLIIQFFAPVKVKSMQLLSHQCKISSKVEIFCAMPTQLNLHSYVMDDIPFRKLGYFLLSPNEQSGFQARELKTVYLEAPMLFLKLVLQKPHINSLNVFNQVGIIGLSFNGQSLAQGASGNVGMTIKPDLGLQAQYDPKTLTELEQLEKAKSIAISEEDFILAKQLKEQIDQLKKHAEQLLRLEQRKEIAIQNEDYDAAMLIKQEIQRLRERLHANKQRPNYGHPESNYGRQGYNAYNEPPYDPYSRNQPGFDDRFEDQHGRNERVTGGPMSPGNANAYGGPSFNQRNVEPRSRQARRNSSREREGQYYDQRHMDRTISDDRPLSNANRKYPEDDRPLNVNNRAQMDDDRPLPALNKQAKGSYENEIEEEPVPALKNKRTAGRQRTANSDRRQGDDLPDHEEAPPRANRNQAPEKVNPFDEAPLPALANKQNGQMMDEYPEDEAEKTEGEDKPNVSKKNMVRLETFATKFDRSLLMHVFSTNWQHRDSACSQLIDELKKMSKGKARLPTEKVLSGDLESAIIALWKLNNVIFEDRVPQIIGQSLTIYEMCIATASNNNIKLKTVADFSKAFEDMTMLMMDKVSDFKNNQMLKQVSLIFLGCLTNKLIEIDEIIGHFTKTKSVAKKLLSFKHMIGRLKVLQMILKKEGNRCKNSIKELLQFCAGNMENSNQDVRAESQRLIVEIAKIIGEDRVISFLEGEGLRRQQMDKIKEGLANMEESDEESEEEQPVSKPVKQTNKQPKKAEPVEKPSQQPEEEESFEEEKRTMCNFCHQINSNFEDNDQYDMHLWKECPMLATCRYCDQVVEIADLNQHILNECKEADSFSKCPRCQMPIENDEFEDHTSDMNCKVFKLNGKFARCALCQQDFPIPGNDLGRAWREHLVTKGCPENPRTNV